MHGAGESSAYAVLPTTGRLGWVVSDGRLGIEAMALGLAALLGLRADLKRIDRRTRWGGVAAWTPSDLSNDFVKGTTVLSPWPEIAIAAGRGTAAYLKAIRSASEGATFTVLLQHPRAGPDIADVVWCPTHEQLHGSNVISTVTMPHGIRPHELAALRTKPPPEIRACKAPRVAVLLGGPNGAFEYSPGTLRRLTRALASLARGGASFLVAPSSATTSALLDAVETGIGGAQRIIWNRNGPIPYRECLAAADLVVVTADSMSMTSEACATGRPVYVFMPDGGSPNFLRFHVALRELGVTRALPALPDLQSSWTYQPLDAAPRIAAEIARRFEAARIASGGA